MIRHIRCTLYTHDMALLTACGIFLVFGLEFRNNAADLSQISIICDALNGIVWKDDVQIVDGRVVKLYAEQPRVEVEIWRIGQNG